MESVVSRVVIWENTFSSGNKPCLDFKEKGAFYREVYVSCGMNSVLFALVWLTRHGFCVGQWQTMPSTFP
jgi:hypothetical protein